jgi:hypothetical protein
MGPRSSLDALDKSILPLPGIEPWVSSLKPTVTLTELMVPLKMKMKGKCSTEKSRPRYEQQELPY